jgi:hypothetical protein
MIINPRAAGTHVKHGCWPSFVFVYGIGIPLADAADIEIETFSVMAATFSSVRGARREAILRGGGLRMRSRGIAPLFVGAFLVTPASFMCRDAAAAAWQSPQASARCPVTVPVRAVAPPDPSADPVSGWWHISADQRLWAPSGPPGVAQTGVGSYWVRPRGTHLTFTARRLDVLGPTVTSAEGSGYPSGFYFGTAEISTEGCWEVKATAGTSEVTFVTLIRYSIEMFARRTAARVAWSKEIGRIEEGNTRLVVSAMVLEDAASVTGSARGIRIDLTDGVIGDHLWEEDRRLAGTRSVMERWASGQLQKMVYGLGRTHNAVGDASGLRIRGNDHEYSFPAHGPADLARLLLQAGDALNGPP